MIAAYALIWAPDVFRQRLINMLFVIIIIFTFSLCDYVSDLLLKQTHNFDTSS